MGLARDDGAATDDPLLARNDEIGELARLFLYVTGAAETSVAEGARPGGRV